jgi:hypothetical protein
VRDPTVVEKGAGVAQGSGGFDAVAKVQLTTAALAALVALASAVYLVGAAVLAGRLSMYSLPWEVVLGQLPQGSLVAIGLTEIVSPLVVIGGGYALFFMAFHEVKGGLFSTTPLDPDADVPRTDWTAVGRVGLLVALGYLLLLAARLLGYGASWTVREAIIGACAAAVGAGAIGIVLIWIRSLIGRWQASYRLPLMSIFVALAFLPLVGWNAITLPLPYAVVCSTKTQAWQGGWLIGQVEDRLLLGTTEPDTAKRHVLAVPIAGAQVIITDNSPPLPSCPALPSGA